MFDVCLRRLSLLLLRSALRITPSDSQAWGQAMLAELEHVEGSRAAVTWAVGCAAALAKETAKDLIVRRRVLVVSSVCIVSLIMFFLIPTLRQAFSSSFSPWTTALQISDRDSALRQLSDTAERERDANTMAFVAMRLKDAEAGARLAEAAVRIDPALTWVYYVVGVRHPGLTDRARKWAADLHSWDPQNAAPHLLTAEAIDIEQIRDIAQTQWKQSNPEWRAAMAAALAARSFDDYLRQQIQLDREVVRQHRLSDPLVFLEGFRYRRVPTYAVSDVMDFLSMFGGSTVAESDAAVVRYLRAEILSRTSIVWWMRPPPARIRVIQFSGILLVCFGVILIVSVAYAPRRPAPALIGATGLLFSALTLYLAYRPFAQIFDNFIRSDAASNFDDLRVFYGVLYPPLAIGRYSAPTLWSYIWAATILVSIAVLIMIGVRHARTRSHGV